MNAQRLIYDYIVDALLDGEADRLDAETPIAELNIIDSAGIFDLVHYLQQEFGITIPLTDVTLRNFRSVSAISALVERVREERVSAG
ncbi:acyl carrier protein [Streptomyces sp. MAR4 CNX-425]|uniref:acyl carrier protein n=1 Tax=Streptomyces sp. MAR4 CNX-425 TaxID=3406343 RepID=UPI003B502F87